jgi:hypothetical protein
MSNIFKAIQSDSAVICNILAHWKDYSGWSLQGFGMLRLYLTKELRLHIWDSRFAVDNVSLLHDHPWDFESLIISGGLTNYRYNFAAGSGYLYSVIQCGAGGCAKTEPAPCALTERSIENLGPTEIYRQIADEIHKSVPDDGTITLIERTFKADTEHARVFWPEGEKWVSAEPRPATPEEVNAITFNALKKWNPTRWKLKT